MLFNSYLVIYTTKDQCNGYAIIHAKNPKEAGQILIRQGMYRDKTYEIVSITQRHCPPENDSIIAQGITTVGLNAYELAVRRGFLGTLDQWLKSLIGPVGPRGSKGDKGDKGDKPIKGIDYFTQEDIDWVNSLVKVPTKVSELENDVPYLNEHQSLDNYYTKPEVDAKLTWD